MSHGVINLLEVIDIKNYHGKLRFAGPRLLLKSCDGFLVSRFILNAG